MQAHVLEIQRPDDFDAGFQTMRKERAQAVLAVMAGPRGYTEAGGLMSYWADEAELLRRTASYVDRILKGADPAGLPIEQPTKYELVVNLKTARTLGLTIPGSLLLRATAIE